jgi:hypothetical protein
MLLTGEGGRARLRNQQVPQYGMTAEPAESFLHLVSEVFIESYSGTVKHKLCETTFAETNYVTAFSFPTNQCLSLWQAHP